MNSNFPKLMGYIKKSVKLQSEMWYHHWKQTEQYNKAANFWPEDQKGRALRNQEVVEDHKEGGAQKIDFLKLLMKS